MYIKFALYLQYKIANRALDMVKSEGAISA